MYGSAERPPSPAALPQSDLSLLAQRHYNSPLYSVQRSSVPIATVPVSSAGAACLTGVPAVGSSRPLLASPTQNLFSDGFAGITTPLLLSRSIRESTLHRVEGGLSRTASNYAPSVDDTDDVHGSATPMEMTDIPQRDASSGSAGAGNASISLPVTAVHPQLPSTSSAAASSSGASGEATTMNFESLWTNIDRYLFAVYTTLQTGDESALRPLRTPRHRMGWYTVIYNACSGSPAKSRELYTRLALLLLHLLESHVLFPILQNVDHSRIQFLTGTEDSIVDEVASASVRLGGSGGVCSTQQQQHQQHHQQVQAQQSASGSGNSGGSFGGWGRFRSIATGGGGGGGGGSARARQSKDMSRNSSFNGSVAGHHQGNAAANTGNNSSFGFMRRLFQSSHRAASPVVSGPHEDVDEERGVVELCRQASSPALPLTPAPTSVAQLLRGRTGWSSTSRPSTPLQTSVGTSSDNAGAAAVTRHHSSVASAPNELHSAFEGFDSTVRSNSGSGLMAPPPPPAPQSFHSASSPAVTVARVTGLRIQTNLSAGTTAATPSNMSVSRSPLPGSSQSPPVSPPVLSRQSTVRSTVSTASSTRSLSATTDTRTATSTAPPSAISSHHTRVASKTGRVLVNDEEEVLCEANTVAAARRPPKRSRPLPLKAHGGVEVAAAAATSKLAKSSPVPPQPPASGYASARTHTSDDAGDGDSLHTMNSSLSSPPSSHGAEHSEGEGSRTLTGGSASGPRRDHRRRRRGGGGGGGHRGGPPPAHQVAGPPNVADDETEDSTAVPSANFVSPSSASLASAEDVGSPFLSMEPSNETYVGPAELEEGAAATAATTVPSPAQQQQPAAAAAAVTASSGGCTTASLPMKRGGSASAPASPTFAAGVSSGGPSPASLPRQASSSSGHGWCNTGRETAVPLRQSSSPRALSPPHTLPHCSGDAAGSNVYGARRFSLCYTFIQEWQTFLIFRGVVLSCFRYLDQYYTRRYGMDTITLMCFKVFYVTVYEPLHPLLVLELRYLTQYVREVFETTGQIAWEQMELIQATYNIMAELVVLVQSTSSYMVAQQQQQPKPISWGVGGATVTNTTSSNAAAAALTSHALVETSRSRTNSRGRGVGAGGGGTDSSASSVGSTPRLDSLEMQSRAPSTTSPTAATTAAAADRLNDSRYHVSRRRRLLSLFSSKRQHGEASAAKEEPRSTPLQTTSPGDSVEAAGHPSAFENRRPSVSCVARSVNSEGGGGGLSVADKALDGEDTARVLDSPSSAGASPLSSPGVSMVVVDLRGTVELRDRLEGHTAAHNLTTQALKQWEGLAADRRLRNGTIVKETAKPLAVMVMEDMGNEYVAGIYSFYRCASDAHRRTEDGRHHYVEWAVAVKELETHVWRRVQLPFLHTALRSALNEVLVVEQHRNILLDRQFGLRALLDEWSSSVKRNDLALAPQVSGGVSGGGGVSAALLGPVAGNTSSFLTPSPSTSHSLVKEASEFLEASMQVGRRSAEQHFISAFPRHPPPRLLPSDRQSRGNPSQAPLATAWVEDTTAAAPHREENSSWRWERVSSASAVISSATAAASAASAGLSALGRGSSELLVERVGARVGGGDISEPTTPQSATHHDPVTGSPTTTPTPTTGETAAEAAAAKATRAGGDLVGTSPEVVQTHGQSMGDQSALGAASAPPAVAALQVLYSLFSDVTVDECFVLMAAVFITKFIRDAADLFEDYVDKTTAVSAGPLSPQPPVGPAAAAAAVANAGVQLATALVDLIDRYTELVETTFQSQPLLRQAVEDAVEEVMCPTRWTKKGSLRAAQHRAQEMLMAAAAAAATSASTNEDGATTSPATPTPDLPSVLLSRDARHATLPLVSLATRHPQAVQRLQLSVLLARYADAFLTQERGGGRVVSGDIFKRLRLIGRLVSLLEDKDTFLEHYRLCLARRLLGTSGSAAPPSTTVAAAGRELEPATPPSSSSSGLLNLEAERQLVSCLQSYLGATGTHAFEAMLRDYEGTQRTRDLFEQEPAFAALSAPIHVQLITSAQWPMYTMPPLTPHVSLQQGMDVFRGYYATIHPSRTLLWVFSLGTATLTAEMASGAKKQIVASTLLSTLLLVVSDAYNARPGCAGSITGAQIARRVGMPFHALRTHLHLLSQHRAFNLLRYIPANAAAKAVKDVSASAAAMTENDSFTLNPTYTHKLRKIRLPLPKTRLTGLPSSEAAADRAMPSATEGADAAAAAAGGGRVTPALESEDAVVHRHVNASRRLLLDTALVRVLKSRRVVLFEDLFQTVVTQLSRQFVPTRRDVKAQLEGLVDRDYVRRSADDPNEFVYVS
ncbi:hypothetical protein ABB37_06770 [Leptomonas pyrrhocoris]|uniref:Cullin family profile domain-containing protein n=1 Tax=Leptomonas pyrrhocoris TaxID=157538 RepID=A0A0M9FXC6_LEPPY|nr:hypothetical protein ABB37_06770 [Leptomonas pyrrhocoris]KPA78015.1 hypothetical protein ABB37_06770 [Leptomonas pyrrhocoris]|eukprot:XP_015656454.1 hypothetical protein ABB37_06770 [Leptomonas pyrrhocoris]